jgi:transposase
MKDKLTPVEPCPHGYNNADGGRFLTPFQRKILNENLQIHDLRPEYRQRIKIMLLADAGYSRTQICQMLGCCYNTVRYWIAIAQSGKAHQLDQNQMGRPKAADESYLNRLKELASGSPRQHGYPFQRWTAQRLRKHLAKETGIEVSDRHVNRLLKDMGLSTQLRNLSPQDSAQSTKAELQDMTRSNIIIQDLAD